MIHTCAKCGTVTSKSPAAEVDKLVEICRTKDAEIGSLRAQLSVARAQTASDRELIVELRGALETIEAQLHATIDAASADGRPNHIYKGPIEAQMLNARAVLGKVAP